MLHDLAKRQAEQQTDQQVVRKDVLQTQLQLQQQAQLQVQQQAQQQAAPFTPSSLTSALKPQPFKKTRKLLLALSVLLIILLGYRALQGVADKSLLLAPGTTTSFENAAPITAEPVITAPENAATITAAPMTATPETSVPITAIPVSAEPVTVAPETATSFSAVASAAITAAPTTVPATEPTTELKTASTAAPKTEPTTELNTALTAAPIATQPETTAQENTAPETASEVVTAAVVPPTQSNGVVASSAASSDLSDSVTSSTNTTMTSADLGKAIGKDPAQLQIEALPQQKLAQQMEQAASAIAQQRWEEALYLLETDAAVADYPPLFALKAAVLQQLQQWSAALALYQQLLLQEPQHASWNLSAGIAAQQLQQTGLANQYFQVAWLGRQNLSQASQQFLQQQLNPMN
ncbi:hypothetical protein GCM10008111_00370 [Alishewanella tabrizica]|uniref:Tetratricopeptide repeat protein n=2 Tax=Alishewanella tabrizica TaxID=671278 RepID=A0ABQ2WF46_9ALTE|nr:hypothetical protein GCM10008111_00370 [Alishewanella tabrizica]